ncbi:MAG: shikimate kinase [Xanthomonadales bacterium]|nr:shikimate kinase [Xanthomonadales bacterium]
MACAEHIALVGPTGAGKSSIGRALADLLGRPFVDLDHAIEATAGARVALIFEHEGESGFRRRESEALARALAAPLPSLIACGGGVVLDPGNRARLREHALVVHLAATIEEQLGRLARDRQRPLLQVPDRRARLESLAEQREPLYGATAHLRFHPSGPPAQAARALAGLLARPDTATTGGMP